MAASAISASLQQRPAPEQHQRASEQRASRTGSKSACPSSKRTPEQRAAMEQQACGNRECQSSRTGERGRDGAQDPQRRWKRVVFPTLFCWFLLVLIRATMPCRREETVSLFFILSPY